MDGIMKAVKDPAKFNRWLFDQYRDGDRGTWEERVVDDRAVFNGVIWKTADKKSLDARNILALDSNVIQPAIEQLISQLSANKPRFTAVGREMSDNKMAGYWADILSYIWDYSDGNTRLKMFIKDFCVDGMGVFMGYIDPNADYGKGEVCFKELNPLDVYIDPNSKDPHGLDATNVIIAPVLSEEQIKALYPNFDFEGAIPEEENHATSSREETVDQLLDSNDTTHNHYRVIDRYSKTTEPVFHVYDPNSDYEAVFNEKDYVEYANKPAFIVIKKDREDRFVTHEGAVREIQNTIEQVGFTYHIGVLPDGTETIIPGTEFQEQEGVIPKPGTTTMLKPVTFSDLLKMGAIEYYKTRVPRVRRVLTIGDKLYSDNIMKTTVDGEERALSRIPIIFNMNHHSRNPFPYGEITLTKTTQEQINKVDSQIISHINVSTFPKILVSKGMLNRAEVVKQLSSAGAEIIEVDFDLGGSPVVIQPTPLNSEVFHYRRERINEIEKTIGAWSFQSGDATNAPDTFRGTLTLDEMGHRRSSNKREMIEAAINHLAFVLYEMARMVYTHRKIIRVVKPNHGVKEFVINDLQSDTNRLLNDISVGKYDIRVISGSMLPTNKMARAEYLKSLVAEGLVKNPKWVLRELDLPDIEEIIEEEDLIPQLVSQIQNAGEEIKKLQGDLQTAERETVQANQKVKIAKFESDLKKLQVQLEAGMELAKNRMNDNVKLIASENRKKTSGIKEKS